MEKFAHHHDVHKWQLMRLFSGMIWEQRWHLRLERLRRSLDAYNDAKDACVDMEELIKKQLGDLILTNKQPPIVDMETHTHHLHEAQAKKWTHYLFEFLMLFLAVFLGFVAENVRKVSLKNIVNSSICNR